jgi:hypothetical protein
VTTGQPVEGDGVTLVAIVETTVFDVAAYFASCLTCQWRCHKQPHDRQATAARHAQAHRCQPTKESA